VSFLLDTGWGISILTLVACSLVIGASTLAGAALALVVYSIRLGGRLTGR
jgi:hypothetical protein